jgi:predicted nucleic acid-binding protein
VPNAAIVIVIDASVAVKWVLAEKGASAAFSLQSERLTAPALWLLEAASALWSTAARGQISRKEAEERLSLLREAPVETTAIEDHLGAALRIANQLHHPIYDCVYLAAALRVDSYVVTADRRFIRACASDGILKARVKFLEGV